MSNAFLSAIAAKSNNMTTDRRKKSAADHPAGVLKTSDPKIMEWVDPNGALRTAGLAKTVPATDLPAQIGTVQVIEAHNRIDIYFLSVPNAMQRSVMKGANWKYNPDRVCWYHKDTEENREFLRREYGIAIDRKIIAAPIAPAPITPITNLVIDTDAESPFDTYKRQITELCAELKVEQADLALLAVSALHKQVFSKDA